MLFTKKRSFSVNEGIIKEELKDGDGCVLVKVNLKYPEIKCPQDDPLAKHAKPFYLKLAQGLLEFAKTELYKAAQEQKAIGSEDFKPFSVVMSFEKTFESKDYISFFIDVSIFDGKTERKSERKTQVFERRRGTKCRFADFFDKKSFFEKYKDEIPDIKKFDKELFVLRNEGCEFFMIKENAIESMTVLFANNDIKI